MVFDGKKKTFEARRSVWDEPWLQSQGASLCPLAACAGWSLLEDWKRRLQDVFMIFSSSFQQIFIVFQHVSTVFRFAALFKDEMTPAWRWFHSPSEGSTGLRTEFRVHPLPSQHLQGRSKVSQRARKERSEEILRLKREAEGQWNSDELRLS